jgi:hypothetical protein
MGSSPNLERRFLDEHGVTYGAIKAEHTFLFICMERLGICLYCTTQTKLGLPKQHKSDDRLKLSFEKR